MQKLKARLQSKTKYHIQIKIKIPNLNQEPPASSKAPNDDLKDMDVLCTVKIKVELKCGSWVYQIPVTISKSASRSQTTVRNLQHPPEPQMRT